jgi:hypothetical protein
MSKQLVNKIKETIEKCKVDETISAKVEGRVNKALETPLPPDFTIEDKEWIDNIDGSKIKPGDIL